jgi:hypothetical protein
VLWKDESKFEVFGSQRRTFVRRKKNEKMLEEHGVKLSSMVEAM